MSIASTLVTELPDNVTFLSDSFMWIIAANTNISFWYKWIDSRVGMSSYNTVCAYGTPYCNELQEIRAGNRTAFSVTQSPSSRMNLSHAFMEDLALADGSTYCESFPFDMFPWESEDAKYGLA